MNRSRSVRAIPFVFALVVSLTPPSTAQDTRGFTMGSSAAATTASDPSIRIKDVGFREFKTEGGAPDFAAFTTMLGNARMLAMSIGLETITVVEPLPNYTVDPRAFLEISPDHGWVEIMFTVNPDEMGDTATIDDDLEKELDRGELSGSLFSKVWATDALRLVDEEDTATRVVGASESKVESDDIQALDFHMALYAGDSEFELSTFLIESLPTTPTIFFTLDPTTISSPSIAGWFDDPATSTTELPSSATILRSTWTGSVWTAIEPAMTYVELLGSSGAGAVLDGLVVEANGNLIDEMMFSFRADTVADPFLSTVDSEVLYAKASETSGGTVAKRQLWVTSGSPIPTTTSVGLGIGGGRGVGDFCERDPGRNQNPPNSRPIDVYAVAERIDPDPTLPSFAPGVILPTPGNAPISPSGWRAVDDSGNPVFVTFCTGPKKKGTASVRFGFQNRLGLVGWTTTIWLGPPSAISEIPFGGFPVRRSRLIPPSMAPIDGVQRLVAQWWITYDGATYAAPLLTLNL